MVLLGLTEGKTRNTDVFLSANEHKTKHKHEMTFLLNTTPLGAASYTSSHTPLEQRQAREDDGLHEIRG